MLMVTIQIETTVEVGFSEAFQTLLDMLKQWHKEDSKQDE